VVNAIDHVARPGDPADPFELGPWVQCSSCRRRYRPAGPSGRCYDCAPRRYGPRDATSILMAHGHRVALDGAAWYLDGTRVTAAELESAAREYEEALLRGEDGGDDRLRV
jgi:hypothetical protein